MSSLRVTVIALLFFSECGGAPNDPQLGVGADGGDCHQGQRSVSGGPTEAVGSRYGSTPSVGGGGTSGVSSEGRGGEVDNSQEVVGFGEEVAHQETKVPPPTNPQLLFINISAVSITWEYPASDDPLPIKFLVRVSHDGSTYSDASALLSDSVFVYEGMLVSGFYQFQVLAYFEGVVSVPATTDYFLNGITAPPGPPVSVKANLLTPSEATVEWDAPSTLTTVLYIVYWGDSPQNLSKVREVYQNTHTRFHDLPPDSALFVRLQADISGRLSILSEMVNVTTPPTTPTIECLSCAPLSATQLQLDWEVTTPCSSGSGQLLEVIVYSSTANTSMEKVTTTSCDGNVTLGDLRPWTSYSLGLSLEDLLLNVELADCPTNSCRTLESTPSSAPLHLEVVDASSRSLGLQWSPPPISDQNGPLTHYLLECCRSDDLPLSDEGAWHLSEAWLHPQAPCNITIVKVPSDKPHSVKPQDSVSQESLDVTNLQVLLNQPRSVDLRDTADSIEANVTDASDLVDLASNADLMDTAEINTGDIIDTTDFIDTAEIDTGDSVYATDPTDPAKDTREFLDPKDIIDRKDTTYPTTDFRDTVDSQDTTDLQDLLREVTVQVLLVGLSPSQRYTLRVAAVTTAGEGPYSSVVNGTTGAEVLEFPNKFPLQVSSSHSLSSRTPSPTNPPWTDHTPASVELDTCKQLLLLNWISLITFQKNTTATTSYSNVSFDSYSLVSLASKLCSTSLGGGRELPKITQCSSLKSTEIITKNWYTLSFESSEEMESFLSSPSSHGSFSSDHALSPSPAGPWVLWLELEMQLVNGTSLVVTSERAPLEIPASCVPNSTSGDGRSHLDVALISSLLLLLVLSAIILLITLLAVCRYKQWKRSSSRFPPVLLLEECREMPTVHRELPGWSLGEEEDMSLLRAGDGKCSTSSPSSSEGAPNSEGGPGSEGTPNSEGATEDSCSSSATTDASSIGLEDEVLNDELCSSLTAETLATDTSPSVVHPGVCGRWRVDSHGCVELPSSARKEDCEGSCSIPSSSQQGVGRAEPKTLSVQVGVEEEQLGVRMDREEPDGCSVSSTSSCETVETKDT